MSGSETLVAVEGKSKILMGVVLYGLFIGLLVLGLAIIRLNVVKGSYQLRQAKIEKSKLLEDISANEVKYTELLTPSRIESLAKDKYELTKPTPQQIVYFKSQELSTQETGTSE